MWLGQPSLSFAPSGVPADRRSKASSSASSSSRGQIQCPEAELGQELNLALPGPELAELSRSLVSALLSPLTTGVAKSVCLLLMLQLSSQHQLWTWTCFSTMAVSYLPESVC